MRAVREDTLFRVAALAPFQAASCNLIRSTAGRSTAHSSLSVNPRIGAVSEQVSASSSCSSAQCAGSGDSIASIPTNCTAAAASSGRNGCHGSPGSFCCCGSNSAGGCRIIRQVSPLPSAGLSRSPIATTTTTITTTNSCSGLPYVSVALTGGHLGRPMMPRLPFAAAASYAVAASGAVPTGIPVSCITASSSTGISTSRSVNKLSTSGSNTTDWCRGLAARLTAVRSCCSQSGYGGASADGGGNGNTEPCSDSTLGGAQESSSSGGGDSNGTGSGGDSSSSSGTPFASIRPRVVMVFTCAKCDTRSTKSFSKESYMKGVVLVRCPGCQKLHLIADHLGWFGEEPFVLHEFMAERGENVVRISVDDIPHSSSTGAVGGAAASAAAADAAPGPAVTSPAADEDSSSTRLGAPASAPGAAAAEGGAESDPGVAARAAAAAAAVVGSEGGVFELGSFTQVQDALAEARRLEKQRRPQGNM